MEDLGDAMSGYRDILMLGGGNPSHIPEIQMKLLARMKQIVASPEEFAHVIGDYDAPQGEKEILIILAEFFSREYGWDIGPENIVLTTGSQSAFFMLFNMFSGKYADGSVKKVLLPLTPEYIGYSNVGYGGDIFISKKPSIEIIDNTTFKYHINFSDLEFGEEIGAMCVSRPTNPTGNVLTDEEMANLLDIAKARDIPLIIDNAYGIPFPNIIFADVTLARNENTILCFSLSKLGLPGARTGIIVAREEVVRVISNLNATINLAIGSIGPALVKNMIKTGEIKDLCSRVIRPYYQSKVDFAIALLKKELHGIDFYIHNAEGAIFLWLWFPDCPVSSQELYERLKRRGVLIIPGQHFFPGLEEDWQHKNECIRISYSMSNETVEKGIAIIADEIKKIFKS